MSCRSHLARRIHACPTGDETPCIFEDAAEKRSEGGERSGKDADVEFDTVPYKIAVTTS